MASSKSNELSGRTKAVYHQVVEHDQSESVLQALQHADEILVKSGSVDELREALNVETTHLKDVINSKVKLQETIGTLIAGYDSLTNALGGEIDSMKELTAWESVVGFFSSRAARDMREKRVQRADIDIQLQDLVAQTHAIGNLLAYSPDRLGEDGGASVGEVITIYRREDGVVQPQRRNCLCGSRRLLEVDAVGTPRRNVAEPTCPCALVAEQHHRGSALAPALIDVGALGLLTHGVEV